MALALGLGTNKAHAAGAPAGTAIDNTASVSYTIGSVNTSTSSNLVTVTVAEILDVTVTAQTAIVPVNAGDTQQVGRYLVTNTGNSTETFRLILNSVLPGDQFDPVPATTSIYFDSDATPGLSAGDTPYVIGSNDPVLTAGGSVKVLVVNDIPAGVVDNNTGITRLTADSRTGTGPAGTTFVGQGTNLINPAIAIDAVVGNSTAASSGDTTYKVTGVSLTAAKSQTVVDQFGGGTRPIPGARINYSVVINVAGSGTATNAVFSDNIPANTTYVAGSLRLNAAVLTDGAADDAGDFAAAVPPATPARVRVALGNLTTASGPQTVTFAVTIN